MTAKTKESFLERLFGTPAGRKIIEQVEEENEAQNERARCERRFHDSVKELHAALPELNERCAEADARVTELRGQLRAAVLERNGCHRERLRARFQMDQERSAARQFLAKTADPAIDEVIQLVQQRIAKVAADPVPFPKEHWSLVPDEAWKRIEKVRDARNAEFAELRHAAKKELPALRLIGDQSRIEPVVQFWRRRAAGEAVGEKPVLAATNGSGKRS